mgnify:CR=1 FL=1
MIQSAEDVVKAMNWDHVPVSPQVVQRQLFPELTPEEEQVITHLQKHPDGIQINTLVVESNIAINRMTSLLFNLEMKGVVRALAGGVYKMASKNGRTLSPNLVNLKSNTMKKIT